MRAAPSMLDNMRVVLTATSRRMRVIKIYRCATISIPSLRHSRPSRVTYSFCTGRHVVYSSIPLLFSPHTHSKNKVIHMPRHPQSTLFTIRPKSHAQTLPRRATAIVTSMTGSSSADRRHAAVTLRSTAKPLLSNQQPAVKCISIGAIIVVRLISLHRLHTAQTWTSPRRVQSDRWRLHSLDVHNVANTKHRQLGPGGFSCGRRGGHFVLVDGGWYFQKL